MPPPRFFQLFLVLSMKWLMIVFPVGVIAIMGMPIFAPNALSTVPEWVMPVIGMAAPFALGLISASWLWRRGATVSAVTEPRSDGPTWLSSAMLNRWLYLIALPVFIFAIVLLGRFGVVVPSRLIPAIGIGVVLLLLGLKLVDGIRRFR
jgi:hypothetical protein